MTETTFGCECWTLTTRLEQRISTADMKVIRMIQGVTRWDRKRNEEVKDEGKETKRKTKTKVAR